jgi:hypothetical protein
VQFFSVDRTMLGTALQLPGTPRNLAFSPSGESLHMIFPGDGTLSWRVDAAGLKQEACRLAPANKWCGTWKPSSPVE